jgi:Tol biopolymer transport system component
VAADATDVNGYQLFVFEPDRNTTTPLTAGAATGNFPVWSSDGSRMAFGSNRTGIYDIYVKASNGSSPDEPLVVNGNNKFLSDWSRDGRFVLYGEDQKAGGRQNLWVLPMTGDRKPTVYLDEVNDIREGRFSPDGQWVAYTSRLPSGSQVFVASFPSPSVKLQISVTGGARPVWRDDGKELFFIGEMSQLMAVDINPGPPIRAGTPVPLFRTDLFNTLVTFDAYRGGQRFVMPAFIRGDQSVRVILNWPSLVTPH